MEKMAQVNMGKLLHNCICVVQTPYYYCSFTLQGVRSLHLLALCLHSDHHSTQSPDCPVQCQFRGAQRDR